MALLYWFFDGKHKSGVLSRDLRFLVFYIHFFNDKLMAVQGWDIKWYNKNRSRLLRVTERMLAVIEKDFVKLDLANAVVKNLNDRRYKFSLAKVKQILSRLEKNLVSQVNFYLRNKNISSQDSMSSAAKNLNNLVKREMVLLFGDMKALHHMVNKTNRDYVTKLVHYFKYR